MRISNVEINRPSARRASLPGTAYVLPAAALQRAGLRDPGHARAFEPLADLCLPGLEPDLGLGALRLEPSCGGALSPPGAGVAAAGARCALAAVLSQRRLPGHRFRPSAAERADPAVVRHRSAGDLRLGRLLPGGRLAAHHA